MCVIAVFGERCRSAHHDDAKRNHSQRANLSTLIPCGRVHVFSQVDFTIKQLVVAAKEHSSSLLTLPMRQATTDQVRSQ
jgi:hypothetical protein